MGVREQSEQSLLGSGLSHHHFLYILLAKISHTDSSKSRDGGTRLHLDMGGDVKSHGKEHKHKERGRFRAIFVGLSLSLFLDEDTEGQRGSETCLRSDSSEKGTEPSSA